MKISENVYYIGAQAPVRKRVDSIFSTPYGTTYNAYLICGEKNILIDCVHDDFAEDYMTNIEILLKTEKIDMLVINHINPYFTKCIKLLLSRNPDMVIRGSIVTLKLLKDMTDIPFKESVIKDGMEEDGLVFAVTPNLYSPDTVMTYYRPDSILFSGEFFSSNYCESIWDDECIMDSIHIKEAETYYKTFMSPFDEFVKRGLEKLESFSPECVCPMHGPLLRKRFNEIAEIYRKYSKKDISEYPSAVICYVSTYGYTQEMARLIYDRLEMRGIRTEVYDASAADKSVILERLRNAYYLIFGTATINKNAPKAMWDILTSMDCINTKDKRSMVFGSYGWSGDAPMHIHKYLNSIKLHPFEKPFLSLFGMSEDDKNKLMEYTDRFLKDE